MMMMMTIVLGLSNSVLESWALGSSPTFCHKYVCFQI
jgi:hypothetical protein